MTGQPRTSLQRRAVAALDGRIHPRVLGLLGSVAVTTRRRMRCAMRYDDGLWVHRYRDGTVVKDSPTGGTARMQDARTREVFLYDYVPRPGDTVLDVGAGMGEETRLFSRLVGDAGRVVSIEAHPHTFRGLEKTVALNRLTNVTALQCAVTAKQETVFIEDQSAYQSNGLTEDSASGIPVPGRTVGEIIASLGVDRVHLLKMNIEGAELPALQGSLDALVAVENLVVSCHDFKADTTLGTDWQRTFAPVTQLLSAAGYATRTRRDHPSPVIRNYVYASRRDR